MKRVVKGSDIYQKTSPDEWKRFERVIEENRPFDIVMDGLNMAHMPDVSVQNKSATYREQITYYEKHVWGPRPHLVY